MVICLKIVFCPLTLFCDISQEATVTSKTSETVALSLGLAVASGLIATAFWKCRMGREAARNKKEALRRRLEQDRFAEEVRAALKLNFIDFSSDAGTVFMFLVSRVVQGLRQQGVDAKTLSPLEASLLAKQVAQAVSDQVPISKGRLDAVDVHKEETVGLIFALKLLHPPVCSKRVALLFTRSRQWPMTMTCQTCRAQ